MERLVRHGSRLESAGGGEVVDTGGKEGEMGEGLGGVEIWWQCCC